MWEMCPAGWIDSWHGNRVSLTAVRRLPVAPSQHNLGATLPTWVANVWSHTHTHSERIWMHCCARSGRSSGNTLRADYSSKLVWGELEHPNWGDAVVWKSNRPCLKNPKEAKVKLMLGLVSCCCWWQLLSPVSLSTPAFSKKKKNVFKLE